MTAFARKEFRLLLPLWGVAMVLAILPVWLLSTDFLDHSRSLIYVAFGIGVTLLGLAPFGQEFSAGTFTTLLAQPVSRHRIWRTKVAWLSAALLTTLIAFLLAYHLRTDMVGASFWTYHSRQEFFLEALQAAGLFTLVAFSGGLWTTLLLRQVGAAFWFTILIPGLLVITTEWVLKDQSNAVQNLTLFGVLAAYSVAGLIWARRQFLTAQDAQWLGGTVSLPSWSRARSLEKSRVRGPLRALLVKEFQSHQISLLVAFGLLVFHLAALAGRKFSDLQPNSNLRFALESVPFLWLLLPWLIGSVAVAEERRLGMMESQLCLPVTRRVQFALKFGVAFILGVVLGAVMPWLVERLGVLAHVSSDFIVSKYDARLQVENAFLILTTLAAALVLLSYYASTMARSTVQALGVAAVVVSAFWAMTAMALDESNMESAFYLWRGRLILYIGLPVMLVILFALMFRNYRRLYVDWNLWLRNLAVMAIAVVLVALATSTIYHRTWEVFMRLEPRHGPAQLTASVRAKICFGVGYRLFVLAPDGRLWVAGKYEWKELNEYDDSVEPGTNAPSRKKIRRPVPVTGSFVGSSNWVSIAGYFRQIAGLQSDGSLWQIYSIGPNTRWSWTNSAETITPRRVGNDSDWKAIAASAGCVLALKTDGTLWGWGENWAGELGTAPQYVSPTNGPVRIGTDSDWTGIFSSENVAIGIKRDGSVWKWGQVSPSPDTWGHYVNTPQPEPVRWSLDGKGWRTVVGEPTLDLVLREDGTLWVAGIAPPNLFGQNFDRRYVQHLEQVGTESDWVDVTEQGLLLVGLKKDGRLIQNNIYSRSMLWMKDVREPSRYSDWVAVAQRSDTVALAADGTLCAWTSPYHSVRNLLGPSRRPVWTLNILADTKPQ